MEDKGGNRQRKRELQSPAKHMEARGCRLSLQQDKPLRASLGPSRRPLAHLPCFLLLLVMVGHRRAAATGGGARCLCEAGEAASRQPSPPEPLAWLPLLSKQLLAMMATSSDQRFTWSRPMDGCFDSQCGTASGGGRWARAWHAQPLPTN
jgi:hypothetical protein